MRRKMTKENNEDYYNKKTSYSDELSNLPQNTPYKEFFQSVIEQSKEMLEAGSFYFHRCSDLAISFLNLVVDQS